MDKQEQLATLLIEAYDTTYPEFEEFFHFGPAHVVVDDLNLDSIPFCLAEIDKVIRDPKSCPNLPGNRRINRLFGAGENMQAVGLLLQLLGQLACLTGDLDENATYPANTEHWSGS